MKPEKPHTGKMYNVLYSQKSIRGMEMFFLNCLKWCKKSVLIYFMCNWDLLYSGSYGKNKT